MFLVTFVKMKSFSASWVFPVSSPPVKNGIVTTEDDGTIISVTEPTTNNEQQTTNHFNGIITPGFVNTHCHLELSHMRGAVSEGKGMAGFISELVPKRNTFEAEEISMAIAAGESEMLDNGIVAVGDISNTDHSFAQKKKGNLYYHTFVEVFDIDPKKAQEEFDKGVKLRDQLRAMNNKLRSSLVPHAPYTVTPDLYELLSRVEQRITCIHNQESKAENELFVKKSGELFDLFDRLGFDLDWLEETGKNSIRSTLPLLLQSEKIQLVHNTYTSKKDLLWAQSFVTEPIPGKNTMIYWCTCPNANMYIEKKLPDYKMFMDAKAKMTIGTDSYASNWSLSILDEMKTIQKHFPAITFETMLEWATKNGADFLEIEKTYGTIEAGKKPGLVLVDNLEIDSLKLTKESQAKRLI